MSADRHAPVVVATDGTQRSAGAVRFAIEEARRSGTSLRLLHVTPLIAATDAALSYTSATVADLQGSGEEILAAAVAEARELAPDLDVAGTHVFGARVREIAAGAELGRMIVIGRESRHGIERLVTGTTSAGVASRTVVPTVVVAADWQPTEHGRVVVGIKSAEHADELLEEAFAAAGARGATLDVVHTWELPGAYTDVIESRTHEVDWRRRGERLLDDELAPWRATHPDVKVHISVVHGEPARSLATAAGGADLLILGRPPRDLVHLVRLGATPRAVIRGSDVPVLVLPLSGHRAAAEHAPRGTAQSGAS